MPLVKRAVQPYYVSRCGVPAKIGNPLECIVALTLSNVIRQLASLTKHAEDLFGELFSESCSYVERTRRLEQRVKGLATRVKALNPETEKVSLEDVAVYKHFQSTHPTDQKLLSRASLPAALAECYSKCCSPPTLNKFDQFRDDNRSSMTFYTDPDYFFNLWKASMEQPKRRQQRRAQVKKQTSSTTLPVVAPSVKKKAHHRRVGLSAELDELESEMKTTDGGQRQKQSAQSPKLANENSEHQKRIGSLSSPSRPPPLPPGQPKSQSQHKTPPVKPERVYETPDIRKRGAVRKQSSSALSTADNSSLVYYSTAEGIGGSGNGYCLPVEDAGSNTVYYSSPADASNLRNAQSLVQDTSSAVLPACTQPQDLPPPPPPPPPSGQSPGPPPKPARTEGSMSSMSTSGNAQPAEHARPSIDPRANLLQAIRLGKQLRSVQSTNPVDGAPNSRANQTLGGGGDVASILARRIAIEASDSDYTDADDDDDEDWM